MRLGSVMAHRGLSVYFPSQLMILLSEVLSTTSFIFSRSSSGTSFCSRETFDYMVSISNHNAMYFQLLLLCWRHQSHNLGVSRFPTFPNFSNYYATAVFLCPFTLQHWFVMCRFQLLKYLILKYTHKSINNIAYEEKI